MFEWRPIETAPKDGSVFLVTDGNDYALLTYDMTPGCLPDWSYVAAGDVVWHISYGEKDALNMRATHWMPLPNPPVTR